MRETTRRPILPKAWVESKLDRFLLRAALEPRPWWQAIALWTLKKLARLTIWFSHTFPFLYWPVYVVCLFVRRLLDKRPYQTARSMFLRRLFSLRRPTERRFYTSYAIVNWVTLFLAFGFVDDAIDGIYAYSTYPFGTYKDVIVIDTYRNITNQSTFAVHGYQIINGEKKELYFELGPNVWFWDLYPEFMFGQIPKLGRCNFDTYGITVRIPRRFRLFTAGSLYALNPWIVGIECTAPSIVPPAHG